MWVVLSPLKYLEHKILITFKIWFTNCIMFVLSGFVYIDFFFNCLYWCYCFLFLFSYFNWRQITLQYCGGFFHTLTWISHGCTCVPHPKSPSHLPPHPILLGCPSAPALSAVLCIELGLIIYFTYGNIHVSMLFSQIIPPSQSPEVCSLSLSLLQSCI